MHHIQDIGTLRSDLYKFLFCSCQSFLQIGNQLSFFNVFQLFIAFSHPILPICFHFLIHRLSEPFSCLPDIFWHPDFKTADLIVQVSQ